MAHCCWVFTLNNYTEEEQDFWKTVCEHDVPKITYVTVAKEVGNNGTPHLQGALRLEKPMRRGLIIANFGQAHWEPMVATKNDSAHEYCRKNVTVENADLLIVDSDFRKKGQRSDLISGIRLLEEGGIDMVVEQMPELYVKFHNGLDKLAHRLESQRKQRPMVWWLHGPTGTGKTRLVFTIETYEPKALWVSGDDLRWFDGYEGQHAAVFDDFRGDMCKLRWLLRLLDRYPVRVQVKGGHRQWRPKRIYITSAKSPEECYAADDEKLAQLTRRIDRVIDTRETGWDSMLRILRPSLSSGQLEEPTM